MNKLCSLTLYSSKNLEKKYHRFQTNIKFPNIKKKLPTLIINQHIIMISEGSCDTEDWSNDAENSALITGINYILKYIHIENSYFKL